MSREYTTITIPQRPREVRVPMPGKDAYLDAHELIEIVRQIGSHFFDRETMHAFKSKLYDIYPAADGWYFITSEKHEAHTSYATINEPRLYTVRQLKVLFPDNIRIVEASKFQEFKTLKGARAHAAKLSRYSFT